MFYNILHFIAYYPALTQLGLIFSFNLSYVVLGAAFDLGPRGKVLSLNML
jgi:hypothetical protein